MKIKLLVLSLVISMFLVSCGSGANSSTSSEKTRQEEITTKVDEEPVSEAENEKAEEVVKNNDEPLFDIEKDYTSESNLQYIKFSYTVDNDNKNWVAINYYIIPDDAHDDKEYDAMCYMCYMMAAGLFSEINIDEYWISCHVGSPDDYNRDIEAIFEHGECKMIAGKEYDGLTAMRKAPDWMLELDNEDKNEQSELSVDFEDDLVWMTNRMANIAEECNSYSKVWHINEH